MTTETPAHVEYDDDPALSATGLRGFTLPLSPSGRTSLFPPPPWDYSAEMLVVDFTADRERLARYLPTGLVPTAEGGASFGFGRWSAGADADPRMKADPARGQHDEAYLLIHAMMGEKKVGFLAFSWVSTELSQIRGLVQGFPKKLGAAYISRPVELGRGGPQRQPGHTLHAHVNSMNRRLATASVKLDTAEPEGFVPPPATIPHLYLRMFPTLAPAESPVLELSTLTLRDVEVGSAYSGDAELEFGESEYEELAELGPIQAGRGYHYWYAMTILEGSVVPLES
ncbi:acetoacetate decarboxylase family protein [Herbiconiux moechotypicola]|uniref:Acetoacetate decarboxylase family protein n=1 Tax=Herbiconiux moechotypicola TaxID=637393 RepID=A0ABN3DED0_9MICO|nr:acetoacetate decarboxylase family protein [Herbiconiux moechotypicola]MCS5729294.1 acetoacetate decarboxylase family protein [Herbiconiux moechotypicola]